MSIGAVQHYFATKDDLLLAAYTRAIDQVVARVASLPTEPHAYVRALLRELLPLDAQREAELRVALAFTARSVHSPRLAELYEAGYRALVDAVAGVLGRRGRHRGGRRGRWPCLARAVRARRAQPRRGGGRAGGISDSGPDLTSAAAVVCRCKGS